MPAQCPAARTFVSTGFVPAAITFTSTSSRPGSGVSTSLRESTSGPPKRSMTTARMPIPIGREVTMTTDRPNERTIGEVRRATRLGATSRVARCQPPLLKPREQPTCRGPKDRAVAGSRQRRYAAIRSF
jgi:hypothetical protein